MRTQTVNGDRMVVGFTTTYTFTTDVSSNPDQGEVYNNYVVKFVSDLRQVGGFLRVFQFPPPIKLTATI